MLLDIFRIHSAVTEAAEKEDWAECATHLDRLMSFCQARIRVNQAGIALESLTHEHLTSVSQVEQAIKEVNTLRDKAIKLENSQEANRLSTYCAMLCQRKRDLEAKTKPERRD
jgi:hypothetical protein